MDVLIFMGQSNMQGSTGERCLEVPENGSYEYRYLTDEVIPLVSPVGENIGGDSKEEILAASAFGNGSMVPYFVNTYVRLRRRSSVAIHVAKGNTSISEWGADTERFAKAVAKIKAGISKASAIECIDKIYIIWLQGESDALLFTPQKTYKEKLINIKNALKSEIGFDKFCIIKTGYFAAYADWISGTFEEKMKSDLTIMDAQVNVTEIDSDFVMLTDVTVELSQKSKYLNHKEYGPHYNNAGMKIIGEVAATKLAELSKGDEL